MHKITIDVKPKNLKKILSVLEALQPELIETIQQDKTAELKKIKPVKSSLDKIETASQQKTSSSKYLSKDAYRKKLQKQPILEDEFLSSSTSSGKYLSPKDYKNQLKK